MGTIQHHVAVAVVGYSHGPAEEAFKRVVEYAKTFVDPFSGDHASILIGPVEGLSNGYTSYIMAPDGSKEWWPTSDECNDIRGKFVEEMEAAGADVFVGSWGEMNTTAWSAQDDD